MKITKFVLLFCFSVVRVNARPKFDPCYSSHIVEVKFTKHIHKINTCSFHIKKYLEAGTNVTMRFASNSLLWLFSNNEFGKFDCWHYGFRTCTITLTVNASDFHVDAILPPKYKPWDLYVTNVLINDKEYCTNSTLNSTERSITPKLSCGQRKVKHNQLITHGLEARAGDWPWHVAISSIYNSTFRYICGGSLISDTFVLTAAHCVTKVGVPVLPEYLGISLGKTNLIGPNENPQEREVFKIIVHENFNHTKLDNDIALLKLTTPVIFNDYIQPVCMWSDRVNKTVPIGEITGSVVGWGFDQTDLLSPTLRTAHIPLVSDEICIKRKPTFYGSFLNGYKFCAGLINGTSVCNGDSGGGFVVFIPNEDSGITSSPDGVWFIRGIISLALSRENYKVSVCDPNEYVIFTDVDKYDDWIKEHMK